MYKENSDVRCIIRKLMALAFLPVIAVRPAFSELKNDPTVSELGLSELLEYYDGTWLHKFKQRMCNVHKLIIRTNNRMEGWHHKINQTIGNAHPGVHEFIKVFKGEQSCTEVTIERARLGAVPPARHRKDRKLDERLKNVSLLGIHCQ